MPNGLISKLFNTLFPGQCLCCGLPSGREIDLCMGCEGDFTPLPRHCSRCAEPLITGIICAHCQKNPPEFSAVFCPYLYQSPLDQIILRLKHRDDLSAGKALGTLLTNYIRTERLPHGQMPHVLIPIPLHPRRLLSRGFNQAQEIARIASQQIGIPLQRNLVRRVVHTKTQQNLTRKIRYANLRGAFAASPDVKNLHVAIVDDVVTTTSTARAVSRELTRNGAKKVEIWCIARTPLEK